MKQGWEIKKLGEVCKVIAGQSPASEFYNSEGIGLPFYQGKKEFKDKYIGKPKTWSSETTKEAFEGDVLMSVRAPVGPVNFSTQHICIGRGLAAIRASKSIDKEFLFNFLLKYENEIVGNAGAVFNSISKTQIENISIPFPPLPEQKRIVAILDQCFEAIDQAKANVERNLQNAKELFQNQLNQIFSQKGEGWVEKKLGDEKLLKIIDGDRGKNYPKKTDFFNKEYCVFLNTGNVRQNGFNFDVVVFITKERDDLLRKGKLKRNDVVMTTRGTIGNLGLYNSTVPYKHIRINSGMLILRSKKTEILAEYLFQVCRSSILKEQIKAETTGAAQPQLPIKTLVNLSIPIPVSLDIQKACVKQINDISVLNRALEAHYKQELNSLDELRKSILQKAFSGELTENPLERIRA